LKKTYQEYRDQFKVTGGGVKEGDDAVNLAGKYHHKRLIKDIS